jgi:Topoisomerase C-terminal repeat/Topoisomerase DNA binding C4 zinc finger
MGEEIYGRLGAMRKIRIGGTVHQGGVIGRLWKDTETGLRHRWNETSEALEEAQRTGRVANAINALDRDLGPHFFPVHEDGSDPRLCAACGTGRLGFKIGGYGSFIGCSNYPSCQYTRRLAIEAGGGGGETLKEGMRVLGQHPETAEEITVRRGPYGLYVQQGEAPKDKKFRPKRTSFLARGMDGENLTLEQALRLLSLPRVIGLHPRAPRLVVVEDFVRFGEQGEIQAALVLGWPAGMETTQGPDWDHLERGWAVETDGGPPVLHERDGDAITPITEARAVELGILGRDGEPAEQHIPTITNCLSVERLGETHYAANCLLRNGRSMRVLGESASGALPPAAWFIGQGVVGAANFSLLDELVSRR